MWEWIKAFFRDPVYVEAPLLLPEPAPKQLIMGGEAPKLTPPNTTFRRGMWGVLDGQVGVIHEFKGQDIMFHHVDRETGFTTKEEQISSLRVRQAKFEEIPPCRWGLTRDDAVRLGYAT